MRRGITLIELLLSMAVVAIVTVASTQALVSALNYESHLRQGRDAMTARSRFEDNVTNLIHHAWLSSTASNENSYFIGGEPSIIQQTGGTSSTSSTSTSSSSSSTSNTSSGGSTGGGTGSYGTPNVIVFTAAGLKLPSSYLSSNNDAETNNQTYGPVGGITEVELSQTAVGSGGQGKTGLFLRTQVPADNDPTQGGNEQLLSADVSQIGFEFFDGENWDQAWDSRQQSSTPGRLPAAIRITYRFNGDADDHVFVVRIPSSDATYLNYVTVPG
jgi:prepilin-type N-terminal cleavage/methylation domain-containing protein